MNNLEKYDGTFVGAVIAGTVLYVGWSAFGVVQEFIKSLV